MTYVKIHPPHDHIKEVPVWNAKPRPPDRGGADDAPVTLGLIPPYFLFCLDFTLTIFCVWAIIKLIFNLVIIACYKFGGSNNNFL